MFIQTQTTPNPNTIKFLPGRDVMPTGTHEFIDAQGAKASPLAERIFNLDGVKGVFFSNDYVSVTKTDEASWTFLKARVLAAVMEHFSMGMPLFVEGAVDQASSSDEDSEIVRQIKELLDTRVRPAVAQDGGDIMFDRFDQGIVYLHMRGACAGCPSATMTLKSGIENMLRHYVPEVLEVRPAAEY